MEGTMAGADDYITKPFDIILLKTKVENLLMLRNMLREKYSEEMVLNPKNIVIEDSEQRFLKKIIDAIEKNIANTDFDVDTLSLEVGVSRTQLYRKLIALTDMPVREFIKNIRLKRATQLLAKKMNVLDVAIAVGFKDLSHFRKCFRQEYGISPTKYANRNSGSKVSE
jgi:AraC-like DNA-binding protein